MPPEEIYEPLPIFQQVQDFLELELIAQKKSQKVI
jgi:hypothetical protein